ncbi:MAG: tetrathionate reductase subunit A [Aeromonas sp.]
MDQSKRKFLKGAAIAGGTGVFVAGYSDTLKRLASGIEQGSSGTPTRDPIYGNALAVEYRVDEHGDIHPNPAQRVSHTMCLGCWTLCGVRARIDNESDKIVRIVGNPYHPLSALQQIDFTTPIKQAFVGTSGFQEEGLKGRSTACARGNAMLAQLDSPNRVTRCLKRVGPRGSGQWQTISFEQLVKEVVEGGDLFGEGMVEGLRAIRKLDERLDPANPEYGPKANQLLVSNASDEGRDAFIKRFAFNSFGTRNFANHGAYCGMSFRVGSGALLDDLEKNAHLKPDWDESNFLLFMGTSPQQSGNPFKRQSRQLAAARSRTDQSFSYVVVAPSLPNTVNMPSAPANRWLPIKPATDSALAMGMLRWIIDNQRYAEAFLTAPHEAAAERAGYRGFSNASHLVISDEQHARFGQMLHASDLGLVYTGEPYGLGDPVMVIDAVTQAPMPANACEQAQLWVDTKLGDVAIKSSFQLLAEASREYSLEQYSQECTVPVAAMSELAREFTSHGTKAAVISHGGTMSANGFYTAWAILMLNAMIGNVNAKGGAVASGGKFNPFGEGPRYNLMTFQDIVKPSGVFLSRSKFPYEKTSEYRRKLDAGKNPYPAHEPWFPISGPLLGEHLTAAVNGYPYRAKAWINHMGNPIYGQAGLQHAISEGLKDPAILPLIISIDCFINESSALSDYIVPDTLTYESWGWATAWNGVMTKVSTGRWPVVTPKVVKTVEGDPVCMESFIIAVAKRMALPGFGDQAVKAVDGSMHSLHKAADFSLYGAANVAYLGTPVPEIDDDDLKWSGVARILPELNATLSREEAARVAYLYARGGRFEAASKGRDAQGEPTKRWLSPLMLWNPKVGTLRNSQSGHYLSGTPRFFLPQLADGTPLAQAFTLEKWPLLLSSFKSNTMSSLSIEMDRLRQVHPNNPVRINDQTAAKLGIMTGDKVRIVTPNGSAIALVECVAGVQADTIAIEHGFGHKELGARAHWIDGQKVAANVLCSAGINLNDLAVLDPSRHGRYPLVDWAIGSSARQGLPARIEKVI